VKHEYQVIVVGGGHAGVEAAWAAANRLGTPHSVALVSLDSSKIGVMSCNPAIGGLAKGQLVREIDAMGGLMGLVADATGIQFKLLNTSKGAAVHGPRCQADNLAYARTVQAFINARPEIDIVEGGVERLLTDETTNGGTVHTVQGVVVTTPQGEQVELCAPAVVLTTGTFMRAIMHRGTSTTPGGRQGEEAANPISAALIALGLELGRLKTGTPPRIDRKTINWDSLPIQDGDESPTPFSELSRAGWKIGEVECNQFPLIEQISCRQTYTGPDPTTLSAPISIEPPCSQAKSARRALATAPASKTKSCALQSVNSTAYTSNQNPTKPTGSTATESPRACLRMFKTLLCDRCRGASMPRF